MTGTFISALGALRVHQAWLDVIGNNLANQNTPGFKSSRALFSDQFSREIRPATPPSGTLGGTNPFQIGLGVQLGLVDRDVSQGALDLTGRTFDLALEGLGHFALSDGDRTLYTRVGTFGLDSNHQMVDVRTGHRVFDANGQPFTVDVDAIVPPSVTSRIAFGGNLPAEVTGPLAEVLTSASNFVEGAPAALASGGTGPFATVPGTTYQMELVVNGGAPQSVAITASGASLTAQEIANAIDPLDHVSATVLPSGAIRLESDKNGLGSTIKITPGPAGQDLAALTGLSTSLVIGTETPATGATDLNDLTSNLGDYASGDLIELSGTDADGSPVAATFTYGVDGTTIDDLVAFVDQEFAGATAAFDQVSGNLTLSADAEGDADLSLVFLDGQGQAGGSSWSQHAMVVTTAGAGPDTATSSVEVFDSSGVAHLVTFEYERQSDGTWNLTASIPDGDGTVVAGSVNGITFGADGALLAPPSGVVQLQFGSLGTQSIEIELGEAGSFDGVTQFGGDTTVVSTFQDGYGPGELASLAVEVDGTINGFYTNGQSLALGQFGVATFANQQGLREVGDNYWVETPNSGTRQLAGGTFGSAGSVIGGALEESNVDTAEEFVRMIQAQRGFQANARVISTQDQILEEVVNIV